MGGENEEPQHLGIVGLQDVANGEKVAQGFAHLLLVDVDEAIVQPVFGVGLAGRPLALGDFVFVMGEYEILAAAVDVEGLPQVGHAHGRTLDMPAGPARTPGAVPGRFAGLGGFPQGEVHGIALVLPGGDACAGAHLVHVAFAQLQVVGKLLHGKVDVAVGRIGKAAIHQSLHQADDLVDMFRGLGLASRGQQAEAVHVLVEGANEFFRQFPAADAALVGALDDLVVHIRVVAYVVHLVAEIAQVTIDDVEHDVGAGMADVAVVVDGDSADVHADLAGLQGLEFLLASAQGVVDAQAHRGNLSSVHGGVLPRLTCRLPWPRSHAGRRCG